jgi:hypothetical protein
VAAPDAVTTNDIDTWLQLGGTVEENTAIMAIAVTAGWIVGATAFDAMPTAVPDDVWSAWIELAGIAYDNPTMMTSNQVGEEITMWAGGSQARVAAILRTLSQNYPKTANLPVGSFPPGFAEGPDPDPSWVVNTRGHLGWWWRV